MQSTTDRIQHRDYDETFEQIRLEFIAEQEAGHAPTLDAFAARHPEYAAPLADFILDYLRIENGAARRPLTDQASPEAKRVLARTLTALGIEKTTAPAATLADTRKARALSLGELSRRLLLPTPLTLKIERGQITRWPARLAEKLAEALETTREQAHAILNATAGSFGGETAAAFSAEGNPDVAAVAARRQETFAFEDALARESLTSEQAAFWQSADR